MWTSIFVFLAIGGSSMAFNFGKIFENCNQSKCENDPLRGIELTTDLGIAPNEEQLKIICGPLLERQECIKNTIEECEGKDLEELSASENISVALHSKKLLNIYGIAEVICDEGSLVHEGYVSSVECINEMVRNPPEEDCLREAASVYKAYVQSQRILGVQVNRINKQCVVMAYALACASIQLKERCGELARATLVELVKQAQLLTTFETYFSPYLCSKDQMEELKTTYLDFMDLDEQKKLMFYQIFDTSK